jgi:type I restriction enzyme, S subunit
MINMGEIFAHERIGNIKMDRVPMSDREIDLFAVRAGDLLFARQSLVAAGAGKCALVRCTAETTTFESHLIRVRLDQSKADPEFFHYYFLSPLGKANVQSLVMQVAAAGIRGSELATLQVPVPPLPIQRRIAGILSAYDDQIENSRRCIKILEEMARRIYREWFVHFRFPGHEDCRFLDSPLGEIPEGWEVRTLGEVAALNYGKALTKEARRDGPFPVFGSSGQVGTHECSLTKGPGIVVGRKGNVGSVFWCDDDFFAIDTAYFVTSALPLRFLYYLLPTLNFINSDAAVPGLSRNQAYSLEIVVPPDDVLNSFCKQADILEDQAILLTRQIHNLHRTRDLLLPRLLSGQVDVEALPEPAVAEP